MRRAPRTIIVPVALAEGGEQAIRIAAELATALGAELLVAGIAPLALPETSPDPSGDGLTIAWEEEQQRVLDGLVGERLAELAGKVEEARTRTVLTHGPMGPAVVAAAREYRADLIVVPMRRDGGALGHLIHDHADRHVLHHSDVPVLVVPTDVPTGSTLSAAPPARR